MLQQKKRSKQFDCRSEGDLGSFVKMTSYPSFELIEAKSDPIFEFGNICVFLEFLHFSHLNEIIFWGENPETFTLTEKWAQLPPGCMDINGVTLPFCRASLCTFDCFVSCIATQLYYFE